MKTLILAEKPSVAFDIARVLNISQKKQGYLEGENYLVTWAVGHLITLMEPEDYAAGYKKWNYRDLPILPKKMGLKPYPKTVEQLKIIDRLARRKDVSGFICATDSGREGELIFRYIYEYLKWDKPVQRLWISSMTDEAIHEGFQALKSSKEYDRLYYSAKCRSEADWLVGINATRAYTTLHSELYSIGRVQTPTLALIVDREKELTDFVPKDYYEVHVVISVKNGEMNGVRFEEEISETKIFNEEKALHLADKLKNQTGKIVDIEKKNQKQKSPLLYDLTELQKDANKEHGYTAQQVLDFAQSLYEKHKVITYPRTDSRYLSEDMQKEVPEILSYIDVPPFSPFVQKLKDEKGWNLHFSKRIIDNKKITDHHAIIPSKKSPKLSAMSDGEKRIYYLIVKRFLAVFYPEYCFQSIRIITVIENESCVSKGKIIQQAGWKELYHKTETASKDKKNDLESEAEEEQERSLPPVRKGESAFAKETEVKKKQTTPPKPFTEATLLSAMENAGRYVEDEELKEQLKESSFGTPATRAGIIERLLQVGYIRRHGKSLRATEKGIRLIQMVPKSLKSPETTGRLERGLTKIRKGTLSPEIFIETMHQFVSHIVGNAQKYRR